MGADRRSGLGCPTAPHARRSSSATRPGAAPEGTLDRGVDLGDVQRIGVGERGGSDRLADVLGLRAIEIDQAEERVQLATERLVSFPARCRTHGHRGAADGTPQVWITERSCTTPTRLNGTRPGGADAIDEPSWCGSHLQQATWIVAGYARISPFVRNPVDRARGRDDVLAGRPHVHVIGQLANGAAERVVR